MRMRSPIAGAGTHLRLYYSVAVLFLLFASILTHQPVEANVTILAGFQEYIKDHYTGYNLESVYGLGPAFAERVMRSAVLQFAVSSDDVHTTALQFYPKEVDLIQCRVDGFVEYCQHPWRGNDSLTDVTPPYHADFVITDEPFESPHSPDVVNFPLFVLGVAPIFNLPGIRRLVLDRDTLAKIFRGCTSEPQCLPGSITRWNDTAIKATNPSSIHPLLDAAGEITVVVESGDSQSTAAMRRALSAFEPDFRTQVGYGRTGSWPGTSHAHAIGAHGVIRYVKKHPGSISYAKINFGEELEGIELVEMVSGANHTVVPNTDSLYTAFQEIGLAFGNDGNPPEKRTIDLTGAVGARAWPIASIGYLAFRENDESEHCLAKRATLLKFFEYIYAHQGFGSNIFHDGFAPMTPQASAEVLGYVRDHLMCNSTKLYVPPPEKKVVIVETEESMHQTVGLMSEQFMENHPVVVDIRPMESHLDLKRRFACIGNASCSDYTGGLVVLADENLSSYIIRDDELDKRYELFSMPYCAMATGIIYNFCGYGEENCPYKFKEGLVLDLEVAARILDLDIRYWNDSRIQALNPDKALPNAEIVVVAGPKSSAFHFDFVEVIRRTYHPSFSYLGGGLGSSSYHEAWVDVSLTPFSISFVPFNGTVVENVHKASLVSRGGKVVEPNSKSIEACTRDTYDEISNVFFMSSSEEPDCWPLVQVFNLFMTKQVREATNAYFTQFMYHQAVRKNQIENIADNNGTAGSLKEDVTVLNTAYLGTLVDIRLRSLGLDMAYENFLKLEAVTDITGDPVLLVKHDLGLIPESLIIVMYTLLALELACFAGLAVWVVAHRNRKLIRNSSPVFMLQVLLGAAIMACTVIPLAEQDDYLVARGMTAEELAVEDPALNAACVAQPVLFSLGFFLTFSALFLKSWRLIRIFNNKKLRNLFLRDKQLLAYQFIVILAVVILNLIWAIRDPLVWRRFTVFVDTEQDLVVASIGICYSRTGVYPALPLLIGLLLVLAIGNYLSYLGRRIPTEFNESKWTALAMVVTLEAFVIGIPILALANSQPIPGFIIKAFSSLLVPGATVGLVFVPKVAMAYGWGLIDGESNPWRFVKGDSGSGSNGPKKSSKDQVTPNGGGGGDMSKQVKGSGFSPSLNSLVEGKVTVINTSTANNLQGGDNKVSGMQSANPFFSSELIKSSSFLNRHSSKGKITNTVMSSASTSSSPTSHGSPDTKTKRMSKEFAGSSPSQALAKVLQDDPMRRRFRRYLQTLKMEENVRFWDSIVMFRAEPNEHRRYVSARAIIQTFVLDSSPLQVNLSSKTKDAILRAFNNNDKAALGSMDFFNAASNELFEDLRQSDAFRVFLENDTFSHQDAFNNSKSDPMVVPLSSPPPLSAGPAEHQ